MQRLKIIDCLLPAPLTESRPEYTHADRETHTHSPHMSKTPCCWIKRGRRRVMRPGDRRDYWAKTFHCHLDVFFLFVCFVSLSHLGLKHWHFGVLIFNLFVCASRVHTPILTSCSHKTTWNTCDCYFEMATELFVDLVGLQRQQEQIYAIMPKTVLDINICTPRRENCFYFLINKTG